MFNQRWCLTPEFLALMVAVYEKRNADLTFVKKQAVTRKDSYLKRNASLPAGLALVECYGPIIPFANMIEEACGSVSVEAMRISFKAALDNPAVHTILFDFNSPGGNVEEISAFADDIRASRSQKNIVAFAGGLCASAAYWLASQCQTIYCDQTAELGSIGVLTWASKTSDNKIVLVNSDSPKKVASAETEDGQTEILKILDDLAAVFFGQVSAGRNKTIEDVKAFEGRVFVGKTALARGLVDEITDFESLLTKLSKNEGKHAMMTEDEKKAMLDKDKKIADLEKDNKKLTGDLEAAKIDGDKKAFQSSVDAKLAIMKAAGLKEDHFAVTNFKAMFEDYSMYAGKDWKAKIEAYQLPTLKLSLKTGADNHGKNAGGDDNITAKTTL